MTEYEIFNHFFYRKVHIVQGPGAHELELDKE